MVDPDKIFVTRMLTRDLFAAANLLVIMTVIIIISSSSITISVTTVIS